MGRFANFLILGCSLFFVGCSTHQADPKMDFTPPKYVQQVPPKEKVRSPYNPGSLFGRGDNPVFSDKKAMNVNDIVTVMIDENILATSTGSKKIKRSTNDKLGGAVFAGGPGTLAARANKVSNISVGIDSSNSFNGQGTKQRTEKFTTTISARIIKILENGNYFIDGRREMLIDGQKQILHVNGVIRPEDISQTNMIDSKYIADAKLFYESQGDIKEATEKGWGTKAVESIWPF